MSEPISAAELERLERAARDWRRPEGMTRQMHRNITRNSIRDALRARARRSAG